MKQSQASQKYPLLKKYLVKRKRMQEQSNRSNLSMFSIQMGNQLSTFHQKDPFKKYQTLTTNIDNTVALAEQNEENASALIKSDRHGMQQLLPRINFQAKTSSHDQTLLDSLQNRLKSLKLRSRELTHHQSDPLYLKIQKTVARRVKEKFGKFTRDWVNSTTKRKSRSILEKTFVKTGEMLENARIDAQKRKNTTHLEEMLRNNIDEKTFVFPGVPCREIQGLKGKGGNVVPLFQEIYMAEEVFKKHSNKYP